MKLFWLFVTNLAIESQLPKILLKGWLKYAIYPEFGQTAQNFEKNSKFERVLQQSQDQYGQLEVPNEEAFFFQLTGTQLVLSQTRGEEQQVIRLLSLGDIQPMNSQLPGIFISEELSGVQDVGNFSEGFCFRIGTRQALIWNLCAGSLVFLVMQFEKEAWMHAIMNLVQNMQDQ